MLFTPVSVEELVRAEFPEVVEYEIIVKKRGVMDEISLRVEPSGDRQPIGAEGYGKTTLRKIENQDQSDIPHRCGGAGRTAEVHFEGKTFQRSEGRRRYSLMREVDLERLKSMKAEIDAIEQHALALASLGEGVPAIEKNVRNVLSAA